MKQLTLLPLQACLRFKSSPYTQTAYPDRPATKELIDAVILVSGVYGPLVGLGESRTVSQRKNKAKSSRVSFVMKVPMA